MKLRPKSEVVGRKCGLSAGFEGFCRTAETGAPRIVIKDKTIVHFMQKDVQAGLTSSPL